MPFDDYTLDPYSGGITFRDSSTGEELLTTPEAGMTRMQEIDAQRAALMPGYVPETTGVAYSTDLPPYVANVAPTLPPRQSLFDEGSMALAEAPKAGLVARPDVATSTAAKQLDYIGQRVNSALFGPPAGTSVATAPAAPPPPPPAAGGAQMSPTDKAKIDRMRDGAATIEVPVGAAETGVLAQAAATPGAVPVAPTAAPAKPAAAPAPGAAAAPPRIVRTENTGAQEAAKPAEPPPMVTAQVQDTTTSQQTNARSTQDTVNRELGPSPQARKELFDAWVEQGKITAEQRDLMSRGEYDKAGLTFEQGQFLRDSAIQSAVRIREIENRNQRMAELSEGLSREVAEMRVDPARMWKNASTGEKIQLGIAALLGAWGSALQGRQDNAGVKIIDDAIKRDVDLQMQDIASKRELATDAQKLTRMMIDNGASLQQARNAMTSMMMDSVIMRADSLAKRGSLYRPEDLDATGQPKPGTRSFAYAQAIADLRAKKAETDAKFSAAERGTVQRAVKNEVQGTVNRTVAKTTVPSAPAANPLSGLPVGEYVDEEGKSRPIAIRNIEGVDTPKVLDDLNNLNVARQTIPEIRKKLSSLPARLLGKDLQAAYGLIKQGLSSANKAGAMTESEQKTAEREISSLAEANNILNSIESYVMKKQQQVFAQSGAVYITPEQRDIALAGQKAAKDRKKLWPTRRSSHRPSASTMRAARRWTRRPTTPSSCCGRSAATAWQRATPFHCVSQDRKRPNLSRQARLFAVSLPATTTPLRSTS